MARMTSEQRKRNVIKISADDKSLKNLRQKYLRKFIANRIDEIEKSFEILCGEFGRRFENNEWILMTDDFYYINDVVSLIPNLESDDVKWHCQKSSETANIDKVSLEYKSRDGEIPTGTEAKTIFGKSNKFKQPNGKIKCCSKDYDGLTVTNNNWFYLTTYGISNVKDIFKYGTDDIKEVDILTIPIYRLKEMDAEKISTSEVILLWLNEDLRPDEFKETFDINGTEKSTKTIYSDLRTFKSKGYAEYLVSDPNSNKIVFENKEELIDRIYEECLNGTKFNFLKTESENVDTILNEKKEFVADDEWLADFKKKLLEGDNKRAGLTNYPDEYLYNVNKGHWDLLDYNDSIDSDVIIKLSNPMYAREPKEDTVTNAVGIDFGTKSTVVCYRDNKAGQKIIPINVGKVQEASDLNDFENPSIMYFIDFEKFLKDYDSKIGRPETKWDDLSIAYDALNDLRSADKSNFDSFLTDLKSWCGSYNIVRINDRNNRQPYEFKKFLEIGDGDYNPVEYYAYFLGLYINNMDRGKIFMRYNLSFPVKYEPELRKKIVDSFERGIKKSFPTSLLNDKEEMKKFNIDAKISEPAAYAATALKKFNFKPSEGLEDYYGVFDFGGGTTDFDFGVYRPNNDDDEDGNEYRLIHFGNNGDRTLGGEKLLKYLAFEIFKINRKKLVFSDGAKIKFTCDEGRSEADYVEFENLIDNSSTYANRNMYTLMEKLRWAWEGVKPGEENLEDDYNKGAIYLDLINDRGEVVPNFQLSSFKINEDGSQEFIDLKERLHKRIDKTVGDFFSAMREAFKNGSKNKKYAIKDLKELNVINIFFAGNSSKSKLFQDIFNSYINDDQENIDKLVDRAGTYANDPSSKHNIDYGPQVYDDSDDSSVCKAKKILGLDSNSKLEFRIFEALGTKEAREKQERRGYTVNLEDKTEPTGKTGVAYGLLIDDVDVDTLNESKDGDVGFIYYFGKKSKKGGKFQTIIEKDSGFGGDWIPMYKIKDVRKDYKYFYTQHPDAGSGNMLADDAKYEIFPLYSLDDFVEEGDIICVRAKKKNEVEWRVVQDEKELIVDDPENTKILELTE